MRKQIIAIAAIAVIACMGLASASYAQPTGEFAAFSDCPLLHQGAHSVSQFIVGDGCYVGIQKQAQPTKGLNAKGLNAIGLIAKGQIALFALFVWALGGLPLKTVKGDDIGARTKGVFKEQPNKTIRSNSKIIFENWFALLRLKNLKILRLGGSSYAHAMFHPCKAGDQC